MPSTGVSIGTSARLLPVRNVAPAAGTAGQHAVRFALRTQRSRRLWPLVLCQIGGSPQSGQVFGAPDEIVAPLSKTVRLKRNLVCAKRNLLIGTAHSKIEKAGGREAWRTPDHPGLAPGASEKFAGAFAQVAIAAGAETF